MKPAFIAPKELDFPKEDLDYALKNPPSETEMV